MISDQQLLNMAKQCRNAKELRTRLGYKTHDAYNLNFKPRLDQLGFKFTAPFSKHTDAQVIAAAQGTKSVSEIISKLGLKYYDSKFKDRLIRLGIDIKFDTKYGRGVNHPKRPIADYLVINGPFINSDRLRERLISSGLKKNCCETPNCPTVDTWMGKPITLHLDHINGDKKDCRLENLRILCPNCHSQTKTYARNKKEISMTQEHRHFYVFVRKDLTTVQQMCQAAHAAHEAGIHLGDKNNISSVVICSIPNELELLKVHDKLAQRAIKTVIFREPDIENQITAIATEPIGPEVRRYFSSYPLWK